MNGQRGKIVAFYLDFSYSADYPDDEDD